MKIIQSGVQKDVSNIKVYMNNAQTTVAELFVMQGGIQKLGWNNTSVPPIPVLITNVGSNLINIKFNQDINDFPGGGGTGDLIQVATGKPTFSSGYKTGYPASYATDGSTAIAYSWRTTDPLPAWIGVDLGKQYAVEDFKVYTITNSLQKDFIIQGSDDMTNWTNVFTGTCAYKGYIWQDFPFESKTFRYWRVYITSLQGIYTNELWVIEIQFWGREVGTAGQEVAFTVTDTNNNTYTVNSVTKVDSRNIQLSTSNFIIGDSLTINYDSSLGSISGLNGAITDFTKAFITK